MIEPLSEETLQEAMKLVNDVFPLQTKEERSDYWLPYSLKEAKKPAKSGAHHPVYWVFKESGKVAGIIGLYEYDWPSKLNSKDTCWLAWFCVDPAFRGRGIGSTLLDLAIAEAKKRGKKFLRLYTTTDPNEADAQKLYESRGFKVIKMSSETRGPYKVFYRELALT